MAQENTVVHLEGMPEVVRVGKRGHKFLEYDRLRVWQAKHRALRERIWLAKHRFLQRNPNKLPWPISRVDIELEAQSALRDQGDLYRLQLPSCLIYRIGLCWAPQVALLCCRLRTLHPDWNALQVSRTAVRYRLKGAVAVLKKGV